MSDELQPGQNNDQPENLLALNLGIGDALQLQDASPSGRAPNRRYYVKLIGFLNKVGVIVSHPLQDEKLLEVEDGMNFLVRGFSGRKTYEFNANVLASSSAPYPHLHLSFPKHIECLTMRGALRIKPNLAGWVEPKDSTIKVPAVVVDLSTSGARVQANRQLGNAGDQVKVSFRLPVDDELQDFSIMAVIRNIYTETLTQDHGNTEVMTHGLEFIQPEGSARMVLQGFIYRTMAEG